MGLFDEIKCEYPLPKISETLRKGWFQTKDLGCNLDKYTITKNGNLILRKTKGKVRNVKIPFHGDIRIYTCTGSQENNNLKWYEFIARFTDGRLQWIKKKLK